jgi:4-hydroxy-tetrahydrodipicolinate reductase
MIKIGVLGARGRMGSLVCQTIRDAGDTELVAEVDLGNLLDPLEGCEVVIDFTSPLAVMGNLRWCLQHGRDMVIGTSGFDASRLAEVTEIITQTASESEMPESKRPRILVVPNFSVGAVLMMKFAEQAAKFFESAEIIELHHAGKVDAPSGTAARTAAMIKAARASAGLGPSPDATTTQTPGARGATVDEVHVHSIRLSGLVAHQEVLLGGTGETLTIRHDSLDRASFMPGVLRAVRGIGSLPPGLTVGLDSLLGLPG